MRIDLDLATPPIETVAILAHENVISRPQHVGY